MRSILFVFALFGLLDTTCDTASADSYFDVRLDLASHEVVTSTYGGKVVVRRITNQDIIYGLAGYGFMPNTNLSSARLLERRTPDHDLIMVVRNGTNEYDVSRSFNLSWPQSADYHAILANSTTPSGTQRQVVQRIMQLVDYSGGGFNVQGFATETSITNRGHYYYSIVAKVAGGGEIVSRDGIARDGVLEGTFSMSGPINLGPARPPFPGRPVLPVLAAPPNFPPTPSSPHRL
jgi:hypothetical protein